MKKYQNNREFMPIVSQKKIFFQNAVINWSKTNLRDFPWRRKRTPYKILIAEVLLRRTTSTAVNKIFTCFMENFPSITDIISVSDIDLIESLKPLGYHTQRAKILKEIAIFINQRYNNEIPKAIEELLEIPNIGQYTAGAIRSFGFDEPTPMVDSNIERVIRRVFFKLNNVELTMSDVILISTELMPRKKNVAYWYALLDLGAGVCRYGKPKCDSCPLTSICDNVH